MTAKKDTKPKKIPVAEPKVESEEIRILKAKTDR